MEDRINDLRARLQASSHRITLNIYEVRKLGTLFHTAQQRLDAEQEHFHRLDRELAEIDGRTVVLPKRKPRDTSLKDKPEAKVESIDDQLACLSGDQLKDLINKLMNCKSFNE